MDNQEIRNEEGISLLDIIKLIFKRKLVLGITTGSVFLVLFLAIVLLYNKIVPSYESKFEYSYPTFSENKYLDGSKFEYRDLITLELLNEVKNSNEDLSTIDVKSMYENDDISISVENVAKDNVEAAEYVYTINVEKKYFKNDKQAKLFISALSKFPADKNIDLSEKISYDNYLTLYDSSNVFELKIEMLQNQYELLVTKYDEIIEMFDDILLSDGKLISDYKNSLEIFFKNNSLESLYNDILLNGYILENEAYVNELNVKKNTLLKQKEINNKKLEEFESKISKITDSNSTNSVVLIEGYTAEIVKLVNANSDLDVQIAAIDSKLNSTADSNVFEAKLIVYRNKLKDFADAYSNIEKELVANNTNVYYTYNSVIRTNGKISVVIAGIGSLFMGFMIAAVVNICLGYSSINKKKEENDN